MSLGDEARQQIDTMLGRLENTQRLLATVRLNLNETMGDLLAYTIQDPNPAYELRSATRMLKRAQDALDSDLGEPLLQAHSDIVTYRRNL